MREQIHSTNGEIIQAKKRGTTSTEIGKIKENMELVTKNICFVGGGGELGVIRRSHF